MLMIRCLLFFFFNETATTEIYTLSLHDALPILDAREPDPGPARLLRRAHVPSPGPARQLPRSEEHTSELQSHVNLVCRLLLEKKKNITRCATLITEPATFVF